MNLSPARLPRPLRLAGFAAAVVVLLWLCLAPSDMLPEPETLGDKTEHAVAWFVLTGLGLLLSPGRWRAVAAFALGLGVAVELLQASMGLGRHGDWRDLVADIAGIAAALGLHALARRVLDRA